jgi:hypothetical protein
MLARRVGSFAAAAATARSACVSRVGAAAVAGLRPPSTAFPPAQRLPCAALATNRWMSSTPGSDGKEKEKAGDVKEFERKNFIEIAKSEGETLDQM